MEKDSRWGEGKSFFLARRMEKEGGRKRYKYGGADVAHFSTSSWSRGLRAQKCEVSLPSWRKSRRRCLRRFLRRRIAPQTRSVFFRTAELGRLSVFFLSHQKDFSFASAEERRRKITRQLTYMVRVGVLVYTSRPIVHSDSQMQQSALCKKWNPRVIVHWLDGQNTSTSQKKTIKEPNWRTEITSRLKSIIPRGIFRTWRHFWVIWKMNLFFQVPHPTFLPRFDNERTIWKIMFPHRTFF